MSLYCHTERMLKKIDFYIEWKLLLLMMCNGTREHDVSILDFENSKTFKGLDEPFNLQYKYSSKLDLYFMSIRSAKFLYICLTI